MKKVSILLIALLASAAIVVGQPEPGPKRHGWQSWEIGLGSSFMGGSPAFDVWLQWNIIPRAFGLRTSASVLQVLPGTGTFALSLTALGNPYIGDFGFYLGVGAGATVTISGGTATGTFTTDLLSGLTIPIADIIGFYAQARMLGTVTGGTFTATILPGFGFYILF